MKSNTTRLAVLCLLLACAGSALAEGNCPPGYYPSLVKDYAGCAPVYDASGTGEGGDLAPSPPDPGPRWEFRWGAIAVDRNTGFLGGVDGMKTPVKANAAAIEACRNSGGSSTCKVIASYHNQCGVLAYGIKSYVAYTGSVPEEAARHAIAACSKLTSDCQIYYMGCSYPVEAD